jgi:tetratricopeptide (TPR) repeat protein
LQPDAQFIFGLSDFASPKSPLVTIGAIQDHWDLAKAADWESQHINDPFVTFALGEKYAELQKWSDAERCLKRYISLSPDLRGYTALGEMYKSENRDDLWLTTMEDYLHQEDYGMQHRVVQMDIAHYLMDKGRPADAVTFADAAAETKMSDALYFDAGVHAAVGDWETANNLVSYTTHHYPDGAYTWYLWCMRVGHGDRKTAVAELRQYLTVEGDKISADDADRLAVLELAENNLDAAAAALKLRAKNGGGAWPYLYQALLADEKGDAQARDAALAGAPTGNTPLQKFTVILHDAFAAGPQSKPDTDAIDAQVKRANARDHITICYLTARLMDSRGDKEGAMTYLKKCITPFTGFSQDLPLVFDALRKNNVDPLDLQRAKADDTHLFSLEP